MKLHSAMHPVWCRKKAYDSVCGYSEGETSVASRGLSSLDENDGGGIQGKEYSEISVSDAG